MWDQFSVSGVSHTPGHAHTRTPPVLESREGSSQASCPALPNLRKVEPALWPCPALPLPAWQTPAAPVSVPCWALDEPEPCPSCQQRFLPAFQTASHAWPAALRHYQQAPGNCFSLCTSGPASPCPVNVHEKSSTHFQASTSTFWGRSLQSSAPAGQSQLGWIKRVSVKLQLFNAKCITFSRRWGCFFPQVNKKIPDSQDKS